MSIFNQDSSDPTKGTQEQSGDNPQGQPNTKDDYLMKVVEMKGQHWTDPQEVAKGYLNAQEYIQQLEEKTKALEEAATKADYGQEILSLLQEKAKPQQAATLESTDPNGSALEQTQPQAGNVSEEVLESLVAKVLTNREAASTEAQNRADVEAKMQESFGTDAGDHLKAKSKELGISLDRLSDLAGESPSAFMALMGQSAPKETNQTLHGSLNTSAALQHREERDVRYYTNLMKSNSKEYTKASVQKQMREDKARLGSRFFN